MGRVEPGYKRQRKILKLRFVDPDMEGLVVRCRSTSVEKFLEMQGLADAAEDGETGENAVVELRKMFTDFAEVIITWNLQEDDGTPVPVSAESLLAEDFDFAFAMVKAWLDAVAGVMESLGKKLTPGSTTDPEPTLEASLPMEPLSPNLLSLPVPVSSAAS